MSTKPQAPLQTKRFEPPPSRMAWWRNVFIADSPPPIEKDVVSSLCSRLHSVVLASAFHFLHWLISALAGRGMVLQCL
ncbi:hypothetical protein V8D89_003398 [Ganoderma adspersum]